MSYRQFWNDKAEELCRSNALKTFKPGEIQGAINVAWSLKKTDIFKRANRGSQQGNRLKMFN